jgi:hypothetical protein
VVVTEENFNILNINAIQEAILEIIPEKDLSETAPF